MREEETDGNKEREEGVMGVIGKTENEGGRYSGGKRREIKNETEKRENERELTDGWVSKGEESRRDRLRYREREMF